MKETKEEVEKIDLTKKNTRKTARKATSQKTSTATSKRKVTSKPVKNIRKTTDNVKSAVSKKERPKEITRKNKYQFSEYYDLPYRYNQTLVKVLAQTPHALFIYWDISDDDRKEMTDKYGNNFFNETKPILLVHNKTLNSNFEIEIDDFTNSWYLRTPTSNCVFEIELGRKKITQNESIKFENNSNIMHITKSNTIESPNDHILKENLGTVYFKNIKTNELEKRNVSNYNINNVYNLIELYDSKDGYENNPSSGFKIS